VVKRGGEVFGDLVDYLPEIQFYSVMEFLDDLLGNFHVKAQVIWMLKFRAKHQHIDQSRF
jgi:hypothetical protein